MSDTPSNLSILVVCTANICRSPVVEALLRAKLAERGLSSWQVSSSGTMGVEGWPPAAESAALMAVRGIDISDCRSSATTAQLLEASSLVLCMEQTHVDIVCRLHPPSCERVYRLAEMAGEVGDVADPYGGPAALFERMIQEVDQLLDRGLDRIIELASTRPMASG